MYKAMYSVEAAVGLGSTAVKLGIFSWTKTQIVRLLASQLKLSSSVELINTIMTSQHYQSFLMTFIVSSLMFVLPAHPKYENAHSARDNASFGNIIIHRKFDSKNFIFFWFYIFLLVFVHGSEIGETTADQVILWILLFLLRKDSFVGHVCLRTVQLSKRKQ